MAERLKIAFIGAVEGSRGALRALTRADRAPGLVVTLPHEAAHRHSDYADLSGLAAAAGSELFLTRNVNSSDTLAVLREYAPDLCLVIGWSQICGAEFREVARIGTVGFHPAPLPELRGRAPIPWTILAGLTETGSTLFWIDGGTDSGDVLAQRRFAVAPDETARSLYDKHIGALTGMLPDVVAEIAQGRVPAAPQDHARASYCARRRPEDGLIDWTRPADEVARHIRAVGPPYPGAFTAMRGGYLRIDGARPHVEPPGYFGLPGQVQEVTSETLLISCGDFTCLAATDWRSDDEDPPDRHAMLGRSS